MENLVTKVKKLVEPKLINLGYSLVSIDYKRVDKENKLSIVIDRDEAIKIDDIVLITNLISPLLDASDILNDKYVLDISSLGIEKPLDINNLEKYLNKYVTVHLSNPYKGLNIITGSLIEINKDEFTISFKEKTRTINAKILRKYLTKGNIAIKF